MTLALGGIIAFQVYWIDTAMAQNQVQFERNVRETLVQVAQRLEESEATRATAQTFVFFSDEPGGANTNIIFSPDHNAEVRVESIEGTRAVGQANTFVIRADSIAIAPNSQTVVKQRLEKRAKMVDVAISKILRDENIVITERVDRMELDSLLGKSLEEKGIDLQYEYGILDSDSDNLKVVVSNVDAPSEKVITSAYQASLFPNDIDGSSHLLSLYFPGQSAYLLRQAGASLLAGLICIGIILGCFIYTLKIISKQKKLSQIKNDFINNMTHELKTPIATISLATEVLSEGEVIGNRSAIAKYVGVIKDENSRLSHQVERVLQSALLENNELEINTEEIGLHALIGDILETFGSVNPQVDLRINLNAAQDKVAGDIHHLTNVFNNLLDNAVKYSDADCSINVFTRNESNFIQIHVQDNGIGMEAGQIKFIFDSFYRISTGNLHDVKGFGLGLSYVQHIVDLHGGDIQVESQPGKGSEFIISIPYVS